jgi:phage/plasmid primase-like uncharacterized protein
LKTTAKLVSYTASLNAFLASHGLPLQFDSLPHSKQILRGRGLNPHVKDKAYKGKIYAALDWHIHRLSGVQYPVLTVINQKNGGNKTVYNGLEYLLTRLDDTALIPSYIAPTALPEKELSPASTPAPAVEKSEIDRAAAWFKEVEKLLENPAPTPAPHPYLVRKGLGNFSHLFKIINGKVAGKTDSYLVIPFINHENEVVFYQLIGTQETNNKRTIKRSDSADMKGCYAVIGAVSSLPTNTEYVCVAEGVATALTIYAANMSQCVVCAYNASNILHAVESLVKVHTGVNIAIFADNNHEKFDSGKTEKNTGLFAAHETAAKYPKQVKIYLSPRGFADFNDYYQASGLLSEKKVLKFRSVKPVIARLQTALKLCKNFKKVLSLLEETKEIARGETLYKLLSENGVLNTHYEYVNGLKTAFYSFDAMLKFSFENSRLESLNKVDSGLCDFWRNASNKIKKTWKRNARKFLAVETFFLDKNIMRVNDNFLPENIEIKEGITFIKSPMGSGKTHLIRRLLESQAGCRVAYILPLITLADSMARKLNAVNYQHVSASDLTKAERAVCVINSIDKFKGATAYDFLIFDEIEGILNLITSSLIKDKIALIEAFDNLVRKSKKIICMDANLSPASIDFLRAALKRVGKSQVSETLILNEYKRFDGGIVHKYPTQESIFLAITQAVQDGKKLFIPTNSMQLAQKIEEIVLRENPALKVKVVHSETDKEETAFFLNHIDSEHVKYDIVIASPSLTSGVSIELTAGCKHFDAVYGLFLTDGNNGYLPDVFNSVQQLGRVRYARELHVWTENKVYRDLIVDKQQLLANKKKELLAYYEPNEACNLEKTPYVDLFLNMLSRSNFLQKNAALSLDMLLEQDGWQIVPVSTENDNKEDNETGEKTLVKWASETVQLKNATAISNSERLEKEVYEEWKNKPAKHTTAQIKQLKRYELEDFFCVQENNEVLIAALEDKNGRLREKVVNNEIVNAPTDSLKKLDRYHYKEAATYGSEIELSSFARRAEIGKIALSAYVVGAVHKEAATVKAAKKKLLAMSCPIDPNNPMKFLGETVKKLGYEVKGGQITVQGKRVRAYELAGLDSTITQYLELRRAGGKNYVQDKLAEFEIYLPHEEVETLPPVLPTVFDTPHAATEYLQWVVSGLCDIKDWFDTLENTNLCSHEWTKFLDVLVPLLSSVDVTLDVTADKNVLKECFDRALNAV